VSEKENTEEHAKSILSELETFLKEIKKTNSKYSSYSLEFGDPLHYPPLDDIEDLARDATAEQWAEMHAFRKEKVGEVIENLASHIEILRRGAEKRFVGEYDADTDDKFDNELTELTGEIDGQLRKTVQKSEKFLQHITSYFSWKSLQEEWVGSTQGYLKQMYKETETPTSLLRDNIFFDRPSFELQYYCHDWTSSLYPPAHSFVKTVLLDAYSTVYGCITALTTYVLNSNNIEEIKELFGKELDVESYSDTARQFLSNSEVLSEYEFPMSKKQANDINDLLHGLTWSMRKLCTTLESLPIGEGAYKPILSDVNSHIATNSFRPRQTYKNLGIWPLERTDKYQSLSELDLNNWLGLEQHSQDLGCKIELHRIDYRDFIDFVQHLGYEHKKVTSYNGFRRTKPTLTMFDWDGRTCKYRPSAHIYFYNPQCPISGNEMRIAVESMLYSKSGNLTVHVGLDLFSNQGAHDDSTNSSKDEQILLVRENTERFVQQLWSEFDTYQREKGLLKNSKFDANITQISPKGRTFEDMILSDSKKKLLDENIFAILSNSERLIERGVETNRGIMLAGPPGVGKSLTIDAVISKANCTVVFTNFLMLRENMEGIFELSRRYAPTVLILEDIDALGITGQRGESGNGAGLSTLLNCMDGINSNNGVISVATSNHPEQMDWALIARPGRFDVRIDYPYPEKDILKSIMVLKLSSYKTENNLDLDALVMTMPLGFTGSHIHDIVNQANYISVNNSKGDAKKVKITQESLASATERTLYNFNKFLDERPHIQLQNPPSVQEVLKGTKGKKENYHQ
jgi:AAA+ superfamily predicted ATPase